MKIAALYGTTRGSTERIVKSMKDYVNFSYDIYNVKDIYDYEFIADYDLYIFFCPTYGDKEPQEDIEKFLINNTLDMKGKYFAVCSIGTYEGYDLFLPSCGKITRLEMLDKGAEEFVDMVSIDSLPKHDFIALEKWFLLLNEVCEEKCQILI